MSCVALNSVMGLTPRGRGNLSNCAAIRASDRSIPAWAGNRGQNRPPSPNYGLSRVGGGTGMEPLIRWPRPGLSPRGRGNRPWPESTAIWKRSIPAWAGEPRRRWPKSSASGGLSPRGRGNQRERPPHSRRGGSIPAWAGEPLSPYSIVTFTPVYPRVGGGTRRRCHSSVSSTGLSRVGGGTSSRLPIWPSSIGLSPRGRGNRPGPGAGQRRSRSIPAWAGEPQWREEVIWSVTVYPRVGGGTSSLWSP